MAQIQCPDGSTRGISSETKKFFTTGESKLQKLTKKIEQYDRLITLAKIDMSTSDQRCAKGVITECTAYKIKKDEWNYVARLRKKNEKEFVAIQDKVATQRNKLCTESVPAIINMRQSN